MHFISKSERVPCCRFLENHAGKTPLQMLHNRNTNCPLRHSLRGPDRSRCSGNLILIVLRAHLLSSSLCRVAAKHRRPVLSDDACMYIAQEYGKLRVERRPKV